MRPIIVIRPQPGNSSTVNAARELNLNAHGFPMFKVRPLPWDMPEPDTFDALLIGSGNAIRHSGAAFEAFAGKPAYAVGETSAQMARDAGLTVVATGEGGLQDVLGKLEPDHRRLLRLAGEKRVALLTPDDVSIEERIVYAVDPLPMPLQLVRMLERRCLVLLHSAESARHFAASCAEHGVDRSLVQLACIGERVASAAGEGWQEVRAAQRPAEEALLALASEMCKEDGGFPERKPIIQPEVRQDLMQDQSSSFPMTAQPPRRRSARSQLLVAVLAFALGAAAMGWSAWRGYLGNLVPSSRAPAPEATAAPDETATPETGDGQEKPEAARQLRAVGTVEGRLAMLEDRFSRLNLQANAASGNAARAESLLIAFAARRMIDRGEPLRYLEDQLRMRFTNAQPRAVETIIDFGENPVTIDELSARLDALAPRLAGQSDDVGLWDRISHELSGLFTVRREPASVMSPEARIERARVMLTAGKIPAAVEQVRLLPGAEAANRWVADALRYEAVQKALDLIETTAMLDPSRLQDSEGNSVDQPSPLATPTESASPAKKAG